MKAIISHPFCGAIYWWWDSQRITDWMRHSKKPGHPYYRSLYSNVDKNLDVALACLVLFEELILPPADVAFPWGGSIHFPKGLPDLGVADMDWELSREQLQQISPIESDLLADPVIERVLRRVPPGVRALAIECAAIDIGLLVQHAAPIICGPGRRVLVHRLLELGVPNVDIAKLSTLGQGEQFPDLLGEYSTVVGLSLKSDDIPSMAGIKWNERIRRYASGFQDCLTTPARSVGELYEAIADAWTSADLSSSISSSFAAASRALNVVGLVPGVGTVAGIAGLVADAGSVAAERRDARLRWYELGPEIDRYRSLSSLEKALRDRNLL